MARSIDTIFAQITAAYVSAMAAIGITINPATWSRRNKQQLALRTFAEATGTFEQLNDAYVTDIEAIIAAGSPSTSPWWQAMMFLFQFNTAIPQILQYSTSNLNFGYNPVDPATGLFTKNPLFQIIKYCTVVPGTFGTTIIKVAAQSSGLPADLNTIYPGALAAAQTYVNLINITGITVNVLSGNPDKIYIAGKVTYNGQYSGIIPVTNGTVVQAIQSFLASIPASGIVGASSTVGIMKLTDLIAAVWAVPGVINFELRDVNARIDTVPFSFGTYNLVSAYSWLGEIYNSGAIGAGYMVTESNTGYTINDSLTYIAA